MWWINNWFTALRKGLHIVFYDKNVDDNCDRDEDNFNDADIRGNNWIVASIETENFPILI